MLGTLTKEEFQIDYGLMTLSANEETTERALASHSAASKYQFETLSEFEQQVERTRDKKWKTRHGHMFR